MQRSTPAQQEGRTSDRLDYHRIDPETLSHAISEMNRIADKHALLLQHDHVLAGGLLHYENLLIDAQGGNNAALKSATSPEEFDKLLELAEEQNIADTDTAILHDGARDGFDDGSSISSGAPQLEYLELRKDLMEFKSLFLSTSRAH